MCPFKLDPSLIPAVPIAKTELKCSFTPLGSKAFICAAARSLAGGIRWSGSHGRISVPEVLGLVKAQMVKTRIVPSGAKAGFVAKTIEKDSSREECKLR